MSTHETAISMISAEIETIPGTQFPVMAASVSRMAVVMAYSLGAISSAERDSFTKKIRGLEMTRFVELLKGEAA